jgi:hypothetical protein
MFRLSPWGRCQIDTSTSGKHGFGLPKLFKISSRDGSFAGVYTLRFKNRVGLGPQAEERSNSDLIRVAITQFCAWTGNHDHDFEEDLDTSLARFLGEVSNRHGRVLSATSLLPRERHRDNPCDSACDSRFDNHGDAHRDSHHESKELT